MDVGDHTAHHVDLRLLTASQLQTEIAGSRHVLERVLGHPVYFFAYPFGAYNDAVLSALKSAGFTMAYTTAGWLDGEQRRPADDAADSRWPRRDAERAARSRGRGVTGRSRGGDGRRVAVEFTDARVDDGPGGELAQAMRDEIAETYDGLELDGDSMPRAGHAELSPPDGAFIVGWIDGEPVCCGGVKRLDGQPARSRRCTSFPPSVVGASPRALLDALEQKAERLGYTVARLDTGPKQGNARGLYESATTARSRTSTGIRSRCSGAKSNWLANGRFPLG